MKLKPPKKILILASIFLLVILISILGIFKGREFLTNEAKIGELNKNERLLKTELVSLQKNLDKLKNEDQYKKNQELSEEIKSIKKTYNQATKSYEELLDIKLRIKKTDELDKLFAKSLKQLSERNYASAEGSLKELSLKIQKEQEKLAPSSAPNPIAESAKNLPANNTPPSFGYSRQNVSSEVGIFVVDIVAADLNSSSVIVDTASNSDCRDNCPVLSLADYAGRNGAFAGINGSYFCPASYPSCAGKTNSFDTLLMNKNKVYFNSENNVYSNVPAVVFTGNSARFVGRSSEWGRDTGVDAVLANQPLLVSGGNVVFGGDGEVKRAGKGSRSFVGSTGSTAYIGVVHNASAQEMARVVKAMGIQNALNLDSGGSTALWAGGYKVGPGRNIPNALLFVQK